MRRIAAATALAALWVAPPGLPLARLAWAAPGGEKVVHGDVTFERGGSVTVIEASDGSIIEFDTFDILEHETVEFVQPNEAARVLNRVVGPGATHIDGTLLANGRVYIVNPAGILFGGTAVVDVGGLVAAAGSISDADFLANVDHFTELSGPIENRGDIAAVERVSLIGQQVANYGEIETRDGMIALVAGGDVYLTSLGGRIVVKIDDAAPPREETIGAVNAGTLDAGRGDVFLTTGDLYSLAVNHSGITRGGSIVVDGGDGGRVDVSGVLDASDRGPDGGGGSVDVLGDTVVLRDARIDASGRRGGGRVRIGGDFRGEGDVRSARRTYVGEDVEILADARERGEGGDVTVWADEATAFHGAISARGGARGGDGGFAEVSGRQRLFYRGSADLRAPAGRRGTLLLDPENLRIVDGDNMGAGGSLDALLGDGQIGAGDGGTDETLSELALEAQSELSDIALEADGSVTLEDLSDDTLSIGTQTAGGAGNGLTITADADGDGTGDFVMEGGNDTIRTNGGDVTIDGEQVVVGAIDTSSLQVGADGAAGEDGMAGGAGGNVTLRGDRVTVASIATAGAAGGNAGAAGADGAGRSGGNAGASGNVTIFGTTMVDASAIDTSNAADGGDGSAGTGDGAGGRGGNGGRGGDVTIGGTVVLGTLVATSETVAIGSIDTSSSGSGGAGGDGSGAGSGGRGGDGGIAGNAVLGATSSLQVGSITASAGDGGAGSAGGAAGEAGSAGPGGSGGQVRAEVTERGDLIVGSVVANGGAAPSDGLDSARIFGGPSGLLRFTAHDGSVELGDASVRSGDGEVGGGIRGILVQASDADPDDMGSEGNARLGGTLTALRGDTNVPDPDATQQQVPVIRITADADIEQTGAGPALRVESNDERAYRVELTARNIGATGPVAFAGGADPGDALVVNANGRVDLTAQGLDALTVNQLDATADLDFVQGADRAEIVGAPAAGMTPATSTIAQLDTASSGNELRFTYFLQAQDLPRIVVETGAATLGGDTLIQSTGELVVGTGAGTAITIDDHVLEVRAGDDFQPGGVGPFNGLGRLVDGGTPGGAATIVSDGRVTLAGDSVAPDPMDSLAGSAIGGDQPLEIQGGGDGTLLTLAADGGIDVDVVGEAFDRIAVQQFDAPSSVDVVQVGGDVIEAVGQEGMNGDPATHTILRADTTGSGAGLGYTLAHADTTLVLDNSGDPANGTVVLGGAGYIQASGSIVVGTEQGTAIRMTGGSDLTIQSFDFLQDGVDDGFAAIDMADGGGLLLAAQTGVGEAGDPIVTLGGDAGVDLAATTVDRGITVENADAGDLRVTVLENVDPRAPPEVDATADFAGLVSSISGDISLRNELGEVILTGDFESADAVTAIDSARDVFIEADGFEVDVPNSQIRVLARTMEVRTGDGGIRIHPNGRDEPGIPDVATFGNLTGSALFETTGDFSMGVGEKLSAAGLLEIRAAEARVGDLSALEIEIDAPTIEIQTRDPGTVLLPDGTTVEDFGVDFVANRIRLSGALDVVGPGPPPRIATAGSLAATGPLDGIQVLELAGGVAPEDFLRFPTQTTPAFLLDLAAMGEPIVGIDTETPPRPVEVASLLPPRVHPDDAPDFRARARADDVALFLACAPFDSLAPAKGCRDLDLPPVGTGVTDDPSFGTSLLAAGPSREAAASVRQLLRGAEREALRDAYRDALRGYRERRGGDDVEGAAFREYLEASPEHADVLASVNQVTAVLGRIRLLELGPEQRREVERHVLADFLGRVGAEGLTPESLAGAARADA